MKLFEARDARSKAQEPGDDETWPHSYRGADSAAQHLQTSTANVGSNAVKVAHRWSRTRFDGVARMQAAPQVSQARCNLPA